LADERRSRRFRDRGVDPLTFRVFLAIIGTLLLVLVAFGLTRDTSGGNWWGWLVVALLVLLGAGLVFASIFSSDQNVEKWSDAASNNEVAVIVLIVAFPVAWAIRKIFPSDAT
jgi:hypothetical protein